MTDDVMSTVYRRPSPVDHTNRPAVCRAQWANDWACDGARVARKTAIVNVVDWREIGVSAKWISTVDSSTKKPTCATRTMHVIDVRQSAVGHSQLHAGPTVCNLLPDQHRDSDCTESTFRQSLKTFL